MCQKRIEIEQTRWNVESIIVAVKANKTRVMDLKHKRARDLGWSDVYIKCNYYCTVVIKI